MNLYHYRIPSHNFSPFFKTLNTRSAKIVAFKALNSKLNIPKQSNSLMLKIQAIQITRFRATNFQRFEIGEILSEGIRYSQWKKIASWRKKQKFALFEKKKFHWYVLRTFQKTPNFYAAWDVVPLPLNLGIEDLVGSFKIIKDQKCSLKHAFYSILFDISITKHKKSPF